jgi:hypothetical protein
MNYLDEYKRNLPLGDYIKHLKNKVEKQKKKGIIWIKNLDDQRQARLARNGEGFPK